MLSGIPRVSTLSTAPTNDTHLLRYIVHESVVAVHGHITALNTENGPTLQLHTPPHIMPSMRQNRTLRHAHGPL